MIDNGPEQKDLDKFKEGEANDDVTNMKDNNYWLQNITRATKLKVVINTAFLII